ncbi:hypothetical protein [Gloeothece verrucosa]|uniref:DDE transposase family protein n=1 Tax=Gloeothece verrucosa (strain PCC 7822) TaxID=497965 RepID=E0UF43_GLOV7|nr:hypothetical protein [Gloeothece verrucosa]ADN14295.1 conserved hypothetical protein [Gloeothece verrucosa PCC 7822]
MISSQNWYIVKTPSGYCQIINLENEETPEAEQYWGPFVSQSEAIARRVGLIRAGKCQPQ